MKLSLPERDQALPGRNEPIRISAPHCVLGRGLHPPYPDSVEQILFGMGCFWGAERVFWQLDGVFVTAVGYAGGYTPNPSYEEVCSGSTGHTEVVMVAYEAARVSLQSLLQCFWEAHDPTQGMRQGNDTGTQYRSAIYTSNGGQHQLAVSSCKHYQQALSAAGRGRITTEIDSGRTFYWAEDYHQQYLAKIPHGYCSMRGTGVPFPAAERE